MARFILRFDGFVYNIGTNASIADEEVGGINPLLNFKQARIFLSPEDLLPVWLVSNTGLVLAMIWHGQLDCYRDLRICFVDICSPIGSNNLSELQRHIHQMLLSFLFLCLRGIIWPVFSNAEDTAAFLPDGMDSSIIALAGIDFANLKLSNPVIKQVNSSGVLTEVETTATFFHDQIG